MDRKGSPDRPLQEAPVDAEDIVEMADNYKRALVKLLIRMRDKMLRFPRGDWILRECKRLYEIDYECRYVENLDDVIPGIIPKYLMIPIVGSHPNNHGKVMGFDFVEYLKQGQDSLGQSTMRFPCPVILFHGKYICRSKYPPILKAFRDEQDSGSSRIQAEVPRSALTFSQLLIEATKHPFVARDVGFLKSIEVSHLFDLCKPTECDFKDDIMNCTGLKNKYDDIEVCNIPYPDSESFDESMENIEDITKEYLLKCLQKLVDGRGGLLIQSLNGCLRASLFISLLRLSLWADGVIHQRLKMMEIAFLTLGYDWYPFGSRIHEVQCKKMLKFLFDFLPVISTDEFSITKMLQDQNPAKPSSSRYLKFRPSRREVLKTLSYNLEECYEKSVDYIISFQRESK